MPSVVALVFTGSLPPHTKVPDELKKPKLFSVRCGSGGAGMFLGGRCCSENLTLFVFVVTVKRRNFWRNARLKTTGEAQRVGRVSAITFQRKRGLSPSWFSDGNSGSFYSAHFKESVALFGAKWLFRFLLWPNNVLEIMTNDHDISNIKCVLLIYTNHGTQCC